MYTGIFLKTALRSFQRDKGYVLLNVTGLALGIACFLLIFLFVKDELSYDQFHEKSHRIYRVSVSGNLVLPPALGPALARRLPGVEQVVRLHRYGSYLVERGERQDYEEGVFAADSSFFEVFSFELIEGNPATALTRPGTVVISEHLASKYFGDERSLGQTLEIEDLDFEVSGVLKDIPDNSHFHAHLLFPLVQEEAWQDLTSWDSWYYYTYLLVKEPEALPAVEAGLRSVLLGNLQQDEEETATYQLQPLEEIYLHSDYKGAELGRSGNIRYLYLFVGIALLVLLVACINYVNLATAHAMRRAREVGIRKVAGATRMQLVGRFLGESLLLSVAAAFMGVLLVELALPTFNQLVQKNLSIAYFSTGSILPEVVATALLVGVTAGLYPAFFLSAYRPVSVLRGAFSLQGGGLWLRRTLVVFQFVLSTVLIMATLVVQKQLTYIRNASLGFNEEHVLTIRTSGISVDRDAFKQAVAQIPGVQGITTAGIGPRLNAEVFPEGFTDPEEGIRAYITFVDHNFTDVMDIEMIEGRSFSESYATDEQDAVLVNATAVNRFNWGNAENAIGKTILKGDKKYRVIGVVDDFHYWSLKVIIAPLIIDIEPARSARSPLAVRVGSENIQVTLAALERSWKAVSDRPFRYTFMDEAIESSYNGEIRLAQIFGYFAFLAIGIACLGLFGLASYTVQQRTKEIGVRKVLGASSVQILALFSKEYLKLIGLALILAMPAVYFVMDQWLLNFAYRTTIGISTFILVSTLLFLITILTVGYQSVRAASADPVKSLRYE